MDNHPGIFLYTDGSSRCNPGPGGYGVVLVCGSYVKEMSSGFILTTNNRMELLAVITGLEAIRWDKADVTVVSDSRYVVDAIQKGWLTKWISKNFAKTKNPDLWTRLVPLLGRHNVRFQWVKGHAGHPMNERCDTLATQAADKAALDGGPRDEVFESSADAQMQQAIS